MLRPPLCETVFPVYRGGGGGSIFFFFHFIVLLTRIYRKYKGKGTFSKKCGKKGPVCPVKHSRAVDRKQHFI